METRTKIYEIVKIGAHNFKIFVDSQEYYPFIKSYFRSSDFSQTKQDLTLIIKGNYGVSFLNYDVSVTKGKRYIQYKRADYLIEVDRDFKRATISVYDELALKHALMNVYSAFLVHHNEGLLVHASCVVENGSAHLFSGHSGAGKSTAARLSMPRPLLSDEAAIIQITKKGVMVYDSPFRSEIKRRDNQTPVALKSIQILNQASSNKRCPLQKGDALLQLIDKVFFWPYCKEETIKIIKMLSVLVEQVPVYDLYFQKNDSFWELIS